MVCDPPSPDPSHHRTGELGLGTATVNRKPSVRGGGARGLCCHGDRAFVLGKAGSGTTPARGRGRPQAEGTAEALQQADAGSCPAPAHGSLCPRFLSAFATVSFCVNHGS